MALPIGTLTTRFASVDERPDRQRHLSRNAPSGPDYTFRRPDGCARVGSDRRRVTIVSANAGQSIEGGTSETKRNTPGDQLSYDFVIWEGPQPLSNAHASSDYQRLRADNPSTADPTRRMRTVIDALLRIYPERDGPAGSTSPWIDVPLINAARGSVIYLRTHETMARKVRDLLLSINADMALVMFDPQKGELVPPSGAVERMTKFQLPPPGGLNVHLSAVLAEDLVGSRPEVTILEHPDSCFYLQWLVEAGSLTLEAQSESRIPMEHRLSADQREQMLSLGFQSGDPNWRQVWSDAHANLDDIVKVVTRVFFEVRGAEPGQPMVAHRFPVG